MKAGILFTSLWLLLVGITSADCSLGDLAQPYKSLRYNSLNGHVYKNGAVRRATFGSQRSSYNAIGCSAFVVPMLNKFIYQDKWTAHQRLNWKLYQKTGSDIADAFGLPFACTLTPAQVVSPTEIKNLISMKKLMVGQYYLFDTRFGAAGHTGFIQVIWDGSLKTFQFSGIGKGRDSTDKTYYKPSKSSEKVLAPRSKLPGYTEGSFAKWYQSSQYRASKVRLFRLPLAIPDTLTGQAGTVGTSIGSLSGCNFTSQLSLGSPITIQLAYDCTSRKGIATVTGEMDAYSGLLGLTTFGYTWQGDMTWSGETLTGVLKWTDFADRPSLTLTITADENGDFHASTAVPFTYRQWTDGCTTELMTYTYSLDDLLLTEP